jgi:peptidoglycan/xylan/chitin deacetylase (PgdA/CDA1 family)
MKIPAREIWEAGLAAGVAAGVAVGGFAYASRWPASQIFGRTLTAPRNPRKEPAQIALTFDDGPHPRWTPLLLETLARHKVHATFFLLGKYAATQRPLVMQIHQAGHLIGNHTWSHSQLALASAERTRQELFRTNAELEHIIGAPVRFFRPPFGSRRPATLRIARELGLTPVLWNAMTADWDATLPAQITPRLAKSVLSNQKRGFASNIVLHDASHRTMEVDRSASVAAAGQLIEQFSQTHRFVTLDAWQP